MKLKSLVRNSFDYVKRRIYWILWISLVLYIFYDTFIYYKLGRQFYHLRRILGLGLCISRGTATVINLCFALVLLPICKKLNQLLYRVLSRLWPGLFFFWLEKAKSFHMTVAITLLIFAVVHSVSHCVNLWNFSRGYDELHEEINFASYRNENPLRLLFSPAGLTGVTMLIITLSMGLTSMRVVRRRVYNAFWYTHHLYLLFIVMLIIHPLSGVLKEEIIHNETSLNISQAENTPKFVPIKSKGWLWISLPLACFLLDLLWRICSRNRAKVDILNVSHMAGHTISLTLSCPHEFQCRAGQYVLLQCLEVSLIEWHPFTVVKVPTSYQRFFVVWIRVKGDWTEALQKLLLERAPHEISMLVDGPFSSPMEAVRRSPIAVCVAAGVGITPFVPILHDMLLNPRIRLPGRVHLLWIVRNERELTWLAGLATQTILQLRNANRPDRLHIEFYVTNSHNDVSNKDQNPVAHMVVNEKGHSRVIRDEERVTLLTPNRKRNVSGEKRQEDNSYSVAKEYPLIGCRVRRGRPHWDRVFGYWVHLYPGNPRIRLPGRVHLLWIVRNERELTWLAGLATQTILQLRNANRPDRLHIEFYVTNSHNDVSNKDQNPVAHMVVNEKGHSRVIRDEERVTLLTPNRKRNVSGEKRQEDNSYSVAKEYPLIGCRVRRGRPHWDRVFGYWVHLYPGEHLNVYCCGPKKLVKLLRSNCKLVSKSSKTKFTFVHEGFS